MPPPLRPGGHQRPTLTVRLDLQSGLTLLRKLSSADAPGIALRVQQNLSDVAAAERDVTLEQLVVLAERAHDERSPKVRTTQQRLP